MLKKCWKAGSHILLLVLAAFLLFTACTKSKQASVPVATPLAFQGEYSQDGGAWLPLEESAELSALDGDLILRGNFEVELPKDVVVHFYLDHIACSVYLNGEFVACSAPWGKGTSLSRCARQWVSFSSPGIGAEDIVEIRLHNPHRFGNTEAYSEFLGSIRLGPTAILKSTLGAENLPYRVVGILIMILSIGVIGTALAFSVMQVSLGSRLWLLGLMSLFAGGYITLDTIDVSLWNGLVVFNTYAQQLCIMLAALELGIFLAIYFVTNAKKVAQMMVYAEELFLAVVVVLCLMGKVLIYDTLPFWILAQLILCPVLLGCCVYECWQTRKKHPVLLLSGALLLLTVMLDCVNAYFVWWPKGLVTKITFVFLFVLHWTQSVQNVPKSYQRAAQAEKLANDLKNSRIILAMSQMRTHFVFNVLNAISGMCKYDPEKADQTVVRFAQYLRTNIDIMEDDQPVTFHSALRHLEDYVALEQVRFGDKIQFVTDITAEEFWIPPLILQPIVENSIKHGLTPKPSGGTVILRTWIEENKIRISIQDDGVGFDPSTLDRDQSVGLKNVRFRLYHAMHGKLDIESAPGRGTTVTISIPCEEAEKCV